MIDYFFSTLLVGALRARPVMFELWLFSAGEAGLLGACSCFADTLPAKVHDSCRGDLAIRTDDDVLHL